MSYHFTAQSLQVHELFQLYEVAPDNLDVMHYFFALRNDPLAAQMSRRRAITWEEHTRWWQSTSDYRYLATHAGNKIGTLRVSAEGVISIIVDPAHRGQGHGREMLRQIIPIMKTAGYSRLVAEVAPENVASQKAFQHAGWSPVLFEVACG